MISNAGRIKRKEKKIYLQKHHIAQRTEREKSHLTLAAQMEIVHINSKGFHSVPIKSKQVQ